MTFARGALKTMEQLQSICSSVGGAARGCRSLAEIIQEDIRNTSVSSFLEIAKHALHKFVTAEFQPVIRPLGEMNLGKECEDELLAGVDGFPGNDGGKLLELFKDKAVIAFRKKWLKFEQARPAVLSFAEAAKVDIGATVLGEYADYHNLIAMLVSSEITSTKSAAASASDVEIEPLTRAGLRAEFDTAQHVQGIGVAIEAMFKSPSDAMPRKKMLEIGRTAITKIGADLSEPLAKAMGFEFASPAQSSAASTGIPIIKKELGAIKDDEP